MCSKVYSIRIHVGIQNSVESFRDLTGGSLIGI